MNENTIYTSIDTDRELASILGQFSDDYITNSVVEAIQYKFKPYSNRMPNLPYILNTNFQAVIDHYSGDPTVIKERRNEIYRKILDIICTSYNLSITTEIPDEQLYSVLYLLYQILISEFSERMLVFFSNYITSNSIQLLAAIPEDKKVQTKSAYSKKMYGDPQTIALYENMETIIDMVAGLDVPMIYLFANLSDANTAAFLCNYISDIGDIYKNHFASYIVNSITRTDMITSIKIRYFNSIQTNLIQPKTE